MAPKKTFARLWRVLLFLTLLFVSLPLTPAQASTKDDRFIGSTGNLELDSLITIETSKWKININHFDGNWEAVSFLLASLPDDPTSGDDQIKFPYHGGYTVTQGCHPNGGLFSACPIDAANGKGSAIYSPINGKVTARTSDHIIIENSVWKIALYHGDWVVSVGQSVTVNTKVGTEGNHGYTGYFFYVKEEVNGKVVSVQKWHACGTGSNCGYHTHI